MTTISNSAFSSAGLPRLLVVDQTVSAYQQLLKGLRPGYQVLLLDRQRNGVAQISEALASYVREGIGLESLHILSHGSPGTVYLGSGELSLASLEEHAAQIEQWGAVVDAVVFYGCNVAAGDAGAEFVERLHELTGVQIAASATKTGNAQLGGDWLLQIHSGDVEGASDAELAFEQEVRNAYEGVLATLTVDDDGNGDHTTVAAALTAASAGDTIVITGGTDNIHEEHSITVDKSVTIRSDADDYENRAGATVPGDGAGATVSAEGLGRVFFISDGDTATIQEVTIDDLTITGGVISGDGGGIFNRERLSLTNSTVSGNSADNGGGIYNSSSTAILTDSTVSGNSTPGFGGGIFSRFSTTTLADSTVSGNSASVGGGIANLFSTDTLINSTVSGNSAGGGGGVANNYSTTTLINSTVSGNSAVDVGGIGNLDSITTLTNSIIANSEGGDFSGDAPVLQGVNLVEDGSVVSTATHTVINADPQLGPLQKQTPAALTETHALLAGSPAIDAGVGNPGGTDQNGDPRQFDGDGDGTPQVDLGAVEYECFLTGTLITTEQGEVPVEQLQIGDLVKTLEGTYQPVKWVGHQTFDRASCKPHPFRTYPICIKAGTLGNHLPMRDLYVSPDHALLVDGLLINAGAMTNGESIVQIEMEHFVYHHIELEQHSLLLAEGIPAESYLPQNQARETFDNGNEYEELYPNHNILSLLPMSCPRVSSKRQLPRCISKKLAKIAKTLPATKVEALV